MASRQLDMAQQILHRHTGELKKGRHRKVLDPEAIHDMRVATRRLRAALKTFKTLFPPYAKVLSKDLQKLARLLGKKRDLDVFLAFILKTLDAELTSFPKLAKKLAKVEREILAMLRSTRFAKLLEDLEQLQMTKRYNPRTFAKKQIQKAFHRVLKADHQELHPLRILLKKLRYTCEFFTSLFSLGSCIDRTRKVQDILGEYQDAITGIQILKRHEDQFSSKQHKKIKDAFKMQQDERLKSFAKIWKRYRNLAEKTLAQL